MISAVAYLDRDPLPARRLEFLRVARREHAVLDSIGSAPYPVHTGQDLLDLAARVYRDAMGRGPIEHLALIMHGSTTGILRPGSGHGIHSWAVAPPRLYNVRKFALAWKPILAPNALIIRTHPEPLGAGELQVGW